MRMLVLLALGVGLVGGVEAQDLGARAPTKAAVTAVANVPSTERQGGDTIADAVVVPLPAVHHLGTTAGFVDDYDEACPYTGSTSPDVVYAFTPAADVYLEIDLLGSTYDTKVYVYDEALNLVACNDDYYPDYVSRLENVLFVGAMRSFIVVDGYGGLFGDYVLTLVEYVPCLLDCPVEGLAEGEPPLEDGYQDAHNGGCNSPEFGTPFQDLYGDADGELIFCGVSGWYQVDGNPYRDTDWFNVR